MGAQAPRAWGRRREAAEGSQAWVQTPWGSPRLPGDVLRPYRWDVGSGFIE